MKISLVSPASMEEKDFQSQYEAGTKRGNKFILVEHAGETLQWNVLSKTWNSNDIETNNSAFEPINRYLAVLPQERQAEIFECYRQIRSVLTNTNSENSEDCEELIEATRPLAEKLFGYINYSHFYNWVWTVLKPNIPEKIYERFDPVTMPGSRERTYLLEDYKGLIPLAIIVRMACPFWLDFIYLTRQFISREHKDMLIYSLIRSSWPAKSPAMARLKEFVTHTVGNDCNHPSAILMGIGSDDFVDWALSTLVVTRLPIVDVMGTNSAAPVAPALFAAVRARVQTIITGQPKITKKFTETSSNDDNNQSFLEGFRNRMALTIGQELPGSTYLSAELGRVMEASTDPYGMLQRVAPGIDNMLVLDALQSCQVLHSSFITDEQVDLASWIFHPYSQCRATGNFHKEEMIALIAMAQAVLLHLGKVDLAVLVSAAYTPNDVDAETVIGEQIAPIRAPERAELSKNFPIEQRGRNSRNITNTVIDDVLALVRKLQNYDITCTFSEETMQKFREGNTNRRYFLRRDAAMMFMNLGIELAERPVVEIDPMVIYEQLRERRLGLSK